MIPNTAFEIDLDLIRKYDRPGPRYTSYPTAPHFTPSFDPGRFVASLQQAQDRPLSLYFHLPFCASLCYFCGCTMLVSHNRPRIRTYLDYLILEIGYYASVTRGRVVKQIHWGGGTPTHLTPEEVRMLIAAIRDHYDVAEDAEVSIEIDPRTCTEEHLVVLREGGFNRVSLGVQDFHEPTQRAINRIQPEAMTRNLVEGARAMGFNSVNLDLIYGLPFQTKQTFADTVEKVIELRPDRIALFSYAHVPWMKKHQRVIEDAMLPAPAEKLAILKYATERLTDAGYVFIGMDHFALPEDGLTRALREKSLYRNFQGYATGAECDIIGHGMSAISQSVDCYAQNTKDFNAYYRAVEEGRPATERGYLLDDDDQLRRAVIMRLMCDFSLDFGAFERAYGIDFRSCFEKALAAMPPLEADGLVEVHDDGLTVTEQGRLLIRVIAMPFDRYLRERPEMKFSRTV